MVIRGDLKPWVVHTRNRVCGLVHPRKNWAIYLQCGKAVPRLPFGLGWNTSHQNCDDLGMVNMASGESHIVHRGELETANFITRLPYIPHIPAHLTFFYPR